MLLMFSFVITLAAGVTTAFMDRLYMCLKMANIVYDHIVYKGSKLESESEREREIEIQVPGFYLTFRHFL